MNSHQQELHDLKTRYHDQNAISHAVSIKVSSAAITIIPMFVITIVSSLVGIGLLIEEISITYVLISFAVALLSAISSACLFIYLIVMSSKATKQRRFLNDLAGHIKKVESSELPTKEIDLRI